MEKLYNLVYRSGPHGDECTTYDIKFNKENITVKEFIQTVLENNSDEWGEFYIYYINKNLKDLPYLSNKEKYSKVCMEYKYGEFLGSNGYPDLLDKYIDIDNKNWANGGWTAMSYWIFIKD